MFVLIGIILIVLLFSIGLFIGNYFFNIALSRDSSWFKDNHSLINSAIAEEPAPKIQATTTKQQAAAKEFWDATPKKEQTITSFDQLTLKATMLTPHQSSHRWALCMHGYRSTGYNDMSYIAAKLSELHFNSLIPDQRGHGASAGSYIGMGWNERLDVLQWLDLILAEDPLAEIILVGGSMGAATVLFASGEKLPENVKLIIADCGYTGVKDEFAYILKNSLKLPSEPILFFTNIVVHFRAHFDLYRASTRPQLSKNTRPILYFHGLADTFVPPKMSKENEARTTTDTEILFVEDAPHFSSYIYDPEIYFQTMFSFIKKHMHFD